MAKNESKAIVQPDIAHPEAIDAIAISGRCGCGNTTANKLVAKKLGFYGINYTMRNYATEQGCSMEEIASRAELDPQVDRLIDRRQVELCLTTKHSVLSSRLAIWLLPKASLKVYLHASVEVRGQRIWQREGGTVAEQLHEAARRDQNDAQRFKRLYQIDTQQFFFADLILNAETLDQYQIAEIIVQAYRLRRRGS